MKNTLFYRECKLVTKSITYYLYIIVFLIFMGTQLADTVTIKKPNLTDKSFGVMHTIDHNIIMDQTLLRLYQEIERNSFTTYTYYIQKLVKLDHNSLEKVKNSFIHCTGMSMQEAAKADRIKHKKNLTYDQFLKEMSHVCGVLGNRSIYEQSYIEDRTKTEMNYKQAKQRFQEFCEIDHVTGTYARVFCDYAGIILAILPVFLAVTTCLRDKKAKADEVVYSKQISSFKFVTVRYLANVCMAFLPVIILAFIIPYPYLFDAYSYHVAPDYFAFLKMACIWVLPVIMVSTAVGFVITEWTGKILGIFVQVIWMLLSFISGGIMLCNIGWHFIIRWNHVGDSRYFLTKLPELYVNRSIYVVFAIALVGISIIIHEHRRRGEHTLYEKIVHCE